MDAPPLLLWTRSEQASSCHPDRSIEPGPVFEATNLEDPWSNQTVPERFDASPDSRADVAFALAAGDNSKSAPCNIMTPGGQRARLDNLGSDIGPGLALREMLLAPAGWRSRDGDLDAESRTRPARTQQAAPLPPTPCARWQRWHVPDDRIRGSPPFSPTWTRDGSWSGHVCAAQQAEAGGISEQS